MGDTIFLQFYNQIKDWWTRKKTILLSKWPFWGVQKGDTKFQKLVGSSLNSLKSLTYHLSKRFIPKCSKSFANDFLRVHQDSYYDLCNGFSDTYDLCRSKGDFFWTEHEIDSSKWYSEKTYVGRELSTRLK